MNNTKLSIECSASEDNTYYKQCYHKGDDEAIINQYLMEIIKIINNITIVNYTIHKPILTHNTHTTYNTKRKNIKDKINYAKTINLKK